MVSSTTSYSGNSVTVIDQTGKQRKSVSDALGRLKQVYEAPNDVTYNYLTSYDYDALNSLTTVTQGSQTRTFVYDSLKRLRSATNPESGTVNYQNDNNGNLTQKTDARQIVTTYVYDALNRNTSVSYSNDPNGTLPITHVYDQATNGKGRLYQSQTTGASGSLATIDSYDVLGRPTTARQQFSVSGEWGQSYTTQLGYNLAGGVTSQTYPSGHTVAYGYDGAGRTTSFTGNLGDGTSRTYSNEITYSTLGGLAKEKFGTTTPIYNKLFYNVRGQLSEIRESTSYTGPTDTTWDRGAIINHYSDQCWGMCGGSNSTTSMTDNNGNLKKQEIYIPNQQMRWQQYNHDSLNRLEWAREVLDGGAEQWKQQFTYDRWGNRTINTGSTYGIGINNKAFTVNTANNRLGVPGGQSGVMDYDAAGNLTNDTYTGAGHRTYDAENKITSAWGGNNQAQLYNYDASGQRIKRKVDGVETWQVYGLGGELLAEYAAGGAAASPQKEYGYRNGQLLITTAQGSGPNSLSLNGTTAYAEVPSSASLNITGSLTVEAWVKTNGSSNYQDIVNRESWGQAGTGGGYEMSLTNLGKARLDLYQSPTQYTTLIGNATLSTGVWHHVAAVFDGSQMRLYVDGMLDASVSSSIAPASGTSNVRIGRNSGSGNYFFNGLIDEVRISNSALYTSNFTPATSLTASGSTKGLWKFDGQTTNDSSGNSNHVGVSYPNNALSQKKVSWGKRLVGMATPGFVGYSLEAATYVYGKKFDREIRYPAGTDIALKLRIPAKLNAPRDLKGWPTFSPSAELVTLVNAQPQRVDTKQGNPVDVTNVMLIGTQSEVDEAFRAAGWVDAASLTVSSGLKTFGAVMLKQGYDRAPFSDLYLKGRATDLTFQKQLNTFAKRHHVRIWKVGSYQGKDMWLGAATHDIGMGIDRKGVKPDWYHTVDPRVDGERDKIMNDLMFGGKVKAYCMVERPQMPKKNLTPAGNSRDTDGRMLVLALN